MRFLRILSVLKDFSGFFKDFQDLLGGFCCFEGFFSDSLVNFSFLKDFLPIFLKDFHYLLDGFCCFFSEIFKIHSAAYLGLAAHFRNSEKKCHKTRLTR